MSLRIEITACVDANAWNDFVASHPDADLMQTTHWAGVVAGYHGHTPRYAWVRDGEQPVGALLLFLEPYFQLLTRAGHPTLHGLTKRVLPVLRWKRGPVIPDARRRAEVLDALLDGLRAEARASGALCVEKATTLPDLAQPDYATVLAGSGAWHAHATFLVNLSAGEDAVWAGMKKVARKAVRRAENQGIIVRRVTDEQDLGKVWRMLTEGWERLGTRYGRRQDFLGFLWQNLHPDGHCEFFLAEVGGESVGSMGVWQFNGYVYEFFSGRAHAADATRINVGDAIKWAIIRWGCAQGHRIYDLAGVIPVPMTPKETGIFAFKEKWGGTYAEYAVFSASYRKRRQRVIDTVHGTLRRVERARLARRET